MDDETDPANEQLQSNNDPDSFENALVKPEKPKRNLGLIVGIVAVLACVCFSIGGILIATGQNKVESEKEPVEAVLDRFMEAMVAEDSDAAYALYSPRARRQFSQADVEALLQGNNYVLFEGYQRITIANLKIVAVANTNPDVPQGTVAEVTGTIAYDDDFSGRFEAALEKVDGEWSLHFINITVPPDKLQS